MNDEKPTREGDADDDGVGYGKPPKNTRFQPGRSGNPKGRPKGTKNLKTDLIDELGERVLVREGERARRISKQRGLVKMLMTKTLKGDTKAANLVLSMMMRLLDTGEAAPDVSQPLPEDEREILAAYVEAQGRRGAEASSSDGVEAPEADDGAESRREPTS